MDIHRCRFVDWSPSAINALAFSHTSGSEARGQPLRLAIGRANGDIELWNPLKGLWIHEKTLLGGRDRSVDGLAWVHDPDEKNHDGFLTRGRARLFSIGYSSSVTEWDLVSGLPMRQSSGSHSEVWCLSPQPPTTSKVGKDVLQNTPVDDDTFRGQHIAIGCGDGSLVLLSTADESLNFNNYIGRAPKKGARALCLAWQGRDVVVSGYADSMIRIYNVNTGANLRNMFIGSGPKGGPKETLIWAITCLADGTIVSGDSNGEVTFWDAKNYTQLQCIKAHEADILCLTSSDNGQTLMSGGMDRRTAVYTKTKEGNRVIWHKKAHPRLHTHDMKAMARFDSKKMSFVVSGGVDATPIVTPLREFASENYRTLPYFPQRPLALSSRRRLVSWSAHEVTIWRVSTRAEQNALFEQGVETPEYSVIARLAVKGEESIQCVALSGNGALLGVGTAAETKIFRLRRSKTDSNLPKLKVRKLDLTKSDCPGASRLLHFSPNSKWLLSIDLKNKITITRLSVISLSSAQLISVPVRRRPARNDAPQNSFNGTWGSYDRTVTHAAFSSDSRILVLSDISGTSDTFLLEGDEDLTAPSKNVARPQKHESDSESSSDEGSSDSDASALQSTKSPITTYGQRWVRLPSTLQLPHLPSAPLVLSFRPASVSAAVDSYGRNVNGNTAKYAKHEKPQSISQSHITTPPTEDRLLILTTTHEMLEFHALKGSLTDWSRRNPSALLPDEFKLQRERARGCIWTTTNATQRVWLYSASWLAMFDLSVDLPAPAPTQENSNSIVSAVDASKDDTAAAPTEAQQSRLVAKRAKKRKRAHESQKGTAGAGSRVEGTAESAHKIRRIDKYGRRETIDASPSLQKPGEDGESGDDEDDADTKDVSLALARRNEPSSISQHKPLTNGASHAHEPRGIVDLEKELEAEAEAGAGALEHSDHGPSKSKHFYLTTRYRHILGIVQLTPEDDDDDEPLTNDLEIEDKTHHPPRINGHVEETQGSRKDKSKAVAEEKSRGLEVALIERPPWDLDLPPRFYGRHEYGER